MNATMSRGKGKRRLMSEINVVPYIDVMLVLLIIFMITAPLLTQGITVDLPNAPASPLDPTDNEPLVLSVDREGNYYLNVGDNEDEPVDEATIVERASAVIRRNAQTPVSLEKPVGDEEESEFGHFLTDENQPLPEEAAEENMRKEALRKILDSLSTRERRVLELRFGLDGEHSRTLDEVGRTFNVTRERIRQIENQCLKKLRALADAAKLREVA